MSAPVSPLVVAQVIARNLIPIAGILFFGWNAGNILLLYLVDTLLALAVIFAGVARHFAPVPEDDGWAARINGEAGVVAAALVVMLVFAVPLGIPVVFMMNGLPNVRELLSDPGFRVGLAGQVITAFWSYVGLWRALRTATPEQLQLKRRFALVFLRWMVLVFLAFTVGPLLFGGHPLPFVIVYVAATIFAEVAPDRFLRVMPGGAEDAAPRAAITPRGSRSGRRRRG